MSNELKNLMDILILPFALPVLRESCVMPGLVYTDYKNEVKEQNERIRIPLPQDLGKADDMDVVEGSKSTDLKDLKVDIVLDKWKYKEFKMNDKELRECLSKGIIPSAMEASLKSLANAVDEDLLSLYKDIPYFAGTAGVTPSSSRNIANVRKILNDNLCFTAERRLVIDSEAEVEFLEAFKKAHETGSTTALREANIGRLYNFDIFSDQLMPFHQSGKIIGKYVPILLNNLSIGQNKMNLSWGNPEMISINKGDLFKFAGFDDSFVAVNNYTSDANGNFSEVEFYPALPFEVPVNTSVTFIESHVPNMAFNKNAFALAMRTLSDEESESSTISTMTDPVSGISLRLETWRHSPKSARHWRFDILYGVKTLRPELAARMIG